MSKEDLQSVQVLFSKSRGDEKFIKKKRNYPKGFDYTRKMWYNDR